MGCGVIIPNYDGFNVTRSSFAVFGVICVLGVLFVRFCVPETRGHSLEEIEAAGTNHHKQVPVQQASH